LVNPPVPLIVEFKSKAPPLTSNLLANVIGVLIVCVPLLTVTVGDPFGLRPPECEALNQSIRQCNCLA
jgi:hypothetical protein